MLPVYRLRGLLALALLLAAPLARAQTFQYFFGALSGANEVPPNASTATGHVFGTYVPATRELSVTGSFANLGSNVTAAHVHLGAAGATGPPLFTLTIATSDQRSGTLGGGGVLTEAQATALLTGGLYANVHSTALPDGEIRGQLRATEDSFFGALSGANEVPPNASTATGHVSAAFNPGSRVLTVTGAFANLGSNVTGAHVHIGAAGVNGGIVVPLTITTSDQRSGTLSGSGTLTNEQTVALLTGGLYVNVHSTSLPNGEIRSQLNATMSIAEARAAGVGATVTVEGVVSRAKGSFAYFQDETGGLALRQTSGAFFDAVAAGTIRPGTVLQVTGTLSEFRQLLQINQASATANDLAGFAVVAQGAPPAAQPVTLAQLEANGEAYEAELVAVSNVTIAGSGTFTPATTYPVTDPTSSTNAVTLRVPNAADTDVDGLPIPAVPATVTAVVGQFHTTDPAAGYQLLVIEAGDVTVSVANEPGGPAEGLTLVVANPVGPAATVRFAVPAAGVVRLALYDALGREIAVLAEGPVAAGAHEAVLDAAALAPGVYVLRLEAGDQALSRRLTVVR